MSAVIVEGRYVATSHREFANEILRHFRKGDTIEVDGADRMTHFEYLLLDETLLDKARLGLILEAQITIESATRHARTMRDSREFDNAMQLSQVLWRTGHARQVTWTELAEVTPLRQDPAVAAIEASRAAARRAQGDAEYAMPVSAPPRTHSERVTWEVERLDVRDEAADYRRSRDAEEVEMPEHLSMEDLLADDSVAERHLIADLWPTGGNVLFSAPAKYGKSHIAHNAIRSLVDGGDFLDAFEVTERRRVYLLDFELPKPLLRDWIAEQDIQTTEALGFTSLNRRAGAFRIMDDKVRARWAERIRDHGTEVLILDCLKPVLQALRLDEWREVGIFLDAWDQLCADAGVTESMVIHHHGHGAERAMGDSRALGWPDALWDGLRQDPTDPASPRYFRAHGRDVEAARGLMVMGENRHLTYVQGVSIVSDADALEADVLAEIVASPGSKVSDLIKRVDGFDKNTSKAVLDKLERGGLIRTERGTGNARICWPVTP